MTSKMNACPLCGAHKREVEKRSYPICYICSKFIYPVAYQDLSIPETRKCHTKCLNQINFEIKKAVKTEKQKLITEDYYISDDEDELILRFDDC